MLTPTRLYLDTMAHCLDEAARHMTDETWRAQSARLAAAHLRTVADMIGNQEYPEAAAVMRNVPGELADLEMSDRVIINLDEVHQMLRTLVPVRPNAARLLNIASYLGSALTSLLDALPSLVEG